MTDFLFWLICAILALGLAAPIAFYLRRQDPTKPESPVDFTYEAPEHSPTRHRVGHPPATNPLTAKGYDLSIGVRQPDEPEDPNPYDIRKQA
jgi:hypothetical protein